MQTRSAVDVTVSNTAELRDDALEAVLQLTGPGAAPMLDAAIGEMGGTVRSVRIEQVSHEPGTRCTVAYGVEVDWGRDRTLETMVATTSVEGPPPGAAVVEADGLRVGLWRYPFDPELPGLVDAVSPARLEVLLQRHLRGPHEVEVLTYRPGRRAVVQVRSPDGQLYLKVLRPHRAGRLAEVHRRLTAAGATVPEVLDEQVDAGVLVLGALGGGEARPLRQLFSAGRLDGGGTPAIFEAVRLAPLLDVLASSGLHDRPARRAPLRDATNHLGVLDAILPKERDRLEGLRGQLRLDDAGDPDRIGVGVTVHGDLHDGQVMVDRAGRLVGVLDLDDVGSGARADDLGNLVGHALTLATAAGNGDPAGQLAHRWAEGVWALCDSCGVDRGEVARRAAAAVVSLATGPFRVREADWERRTVDRLAVAATLLERAAHGGPGT